MKRTIALYTKVAVMFGVPTSDDRELARLKTEMCSELNAAGLTAARIESWSARVEAARA